MNVQYEILPDSPHTLSSNYETNAPNRAPPPPPRRHNKTVSGTDDIKYTTALIENMFLYDKCRNSDSLLDVRGSNPGGGARFSAPVQTVLGA